MQVMKGAMDALLGKEVDYTIEGAETIKKAPESTGTSYNIEAQANQEIKFAYCTQFLIMLDTPITLQQENEFKSYLETIGDSIVVVADDEIVKVHVHTNDPGLAMQRGLTYGSLTTIIIENMKLERDEKISALKEKEMQSAGIPEEKEENRQNLQKRWDLFPSASVRESTRSLKVLVSITSLRVVRP